MVQASRSCGAFMRKIFRSDVQTGPNELGPDIVRDNAWIRSDEADQTPRRGQVTHGIKSAGDQLPLMKVTKEDTERGDAACPCTGREYLATALHMRRIDAAPVATVPLANDREKFPGGLDRCLRYSSASRLVKSDGFKLWRRPDAHRMDSRIRSYNFARDCD